MYPTIQGQSALPEQSTMTVSTNITLLTLQGKAIDLGAPVEGWEHESIAQTKQASITPLLMIDFWMGKQVRAGFEYEGGSSI